MGRAALVIPAWNEPESIGAVLAEVPAELFEQVLVVVGGPEDPTADVAAACGARVIQQRGRGYGAACATGAGVAMADGAEVVAFLDGDYSDPPAELRRVIEPLASGRADLVLGCRNMRSHPNALPAHARFGNGLVRALVRAMSRRSFGDLPSCKAIRANCLGRLDMREMTYGWTVEMLVKSARAGLRIEEVWIGYRPRLGGRSKVAGNVRGSIGAASKLITCAFAYARWRPA
jgi:glycosyltransferase involved in cell wall biosynthesis